MAAEEELMSKEEMKKRLHKFVFPSSQVVPPIPTTIQCKADTLCPPNETEELWILFIVNGEPRTLSREDFEEILDRNEVGFNLTFPTKHFSGKDCFSHFVKETKRAIKKHKLDFINSSNFIVEVRNLKCQNFLKFCFVDAQKLKHWWEVKNARTCSETQPRSCKRKSPFIFNLIRRSSIRDSSIESCESSTLKNLQSSGDTITLENSEPSSSICFNSSTNELGVSVDDTEKRQEEMMSSEPSGTIEEHAQKLLKLKLETQSLFERVSHLTAENTKLKEKTLRYCNREPGELVDEVSLEVKKAMEDHSEDDQKDASDDHKPSVSSPKQEERYSPRKLSPVCTKGNNFQIDRDQYLSWSNSNDEDLNSYYHMIHMEDSSTIESLQQNLFLQENLADEIHMKGVCAKEELNKALEQIEALQYEIGRLTKIIDRYRERGDEEGKTRTKLLGEIDVLNETVKKKAKQLSIIGKEKEEQRITIMCLEDKLMETQRQLEEAKTTIKGVEAMEETMKTLSAKLAEYEAQIEFMGRDFGKHMEEVNSFISREQAAKQTLESEIACLEKDKNSLQTLLEKQKELYQSETTRVADLSAKHAHLKAANKKLKEELDNAISLRTTLTHQVTELKTEGEKLKDQNYKYESMKHDLSKLQKTAHMYRSMMQEYELLTRQLKQELEAKEGILRQTTQTLEAVKNQLAESRMDLNKCEKTATVLQKELTSQTSKLFCEVDSIGKDKVAVEKSLSQVICQKKSLEQVHEKLCSKLIRAVRMIMDGKLMRAHLENKIKCYEETTIQQKAQINTLELKVHEFDERSRENQKIIADLRMENEMLMRQVGETDVQKPEKGGGGDAKYVKILEERIRNERVEFDIILSIKNSALLEKEKYISSLQERLLSVTRELNDAKNALLLERKGLAPVNDKQVIPDNRKGLKFMGVQQLFASEFGTGDCDPSHSHHFNNDDSDQS